MGAGSPIALSRPPAANTAGTTSGYPRLPAPLLLSTMRRRTHDIRHAQLGGDLCDAELAVFVGDSLHTNGRDEERRVVNLAENGRANVAVGGLAAHVRDELVRTGCVNSLSYTIHL